MESLSLPGTKTPTDAERNGQPTTAAAPEPKSGPRYGLVELEREPNAAQTRKAIEKNPEARKQDLVSSLSPQGTQARPALALFCFESPDSPLGQYVSSLVQALAQLGDRVHLFCRLPFAGMPAGATVHAVGPTASRNLEADVEDFTLLCAEAFNKQFPSNAEAPALIGLEWSSIQTLQMLSQHTSRDFVLSLSSLERQRSDMSSEASKHIDNIEMSGLRDARTILCQEDGVSNEVRQRLPECKDRLVDAAKAFPTQSFRGVTDPGQIKAHYQIGPIDPTILYIGDLNERHGPDIVMRSIPTLLKNHPQARFVFVGEGDLLWPLRVYARYLLLEGVVRLVGHLEGQALCELIQAADIVVVPSRESTDWWPLQAAWAARKPLIATHTLGCHLPGTPTQRRPGLPAREQHGVGHRTNPVRHQLAGCVGVPRVRGPGRTLWLAGRCGSDDPTGWASLPEFGHGMKTVEKAPRPPRKTSARPGFNSATAWKPWNTNQSVSSWVELRDTCRAVKSSAYP